jgi:hypothetical protein
LQRRGATLLLSGLHAQPLIALERSGALKRIGADRVFTDFADAVSFAKSSVERPE